ncbi:hypothetical protein ACP70R_006652 [Stipagrostis hirtigluma subsp. patula]
MGTATAASVADGLRRRLRTVVYLSGLASKLREGVRHMEPAMSKLHLKLLFMALQKRSLEMFFGAEMREIKQVLYEVEDLMDDLEGRFGSCPGKKVTLFWSPSSLLWHITMAHRIKVISGKLDRVAEASFMSSLFLLACPNAEQPEEVVKFHEATHVGRYHEKKEIKGLGKTSLARLVFIDKEEAWDFDLRIWISLGKDWDLKKIARCIISEANKSVEKKSSQFGMDDKIEGNLELMKINVREILNSNNCLIVLDNLWSLYHGQLDDLKKMLTPIEKCTKVIVTTHSEKTAELMRTVPPYRLGCLSEDDSSAIFSRKAFGNGDAVADSRYTKFGKDIVKRCKGIPLLAQSLGSLVHGQDIDTWLAARDEQLWKLEDRFAPKAKLFTSFKEIYYSLPLELKPCFLYLSVFPKGSNIDKDALIRQWIALDLLRSPHGIIPAHIVGEQYIRDLVSISFLQTLDKSLITEIKCTNARVILQMHDLVHEFVRYIARDDLLVLDYRKALDEGSRRFSCRYAVLANCSGQSLVHKDLIMRSKVVCFRYCEATEQIADAFSILQHTRILDLSGCPFVELPTSISQLKNLRYLNASNSQIKTLPNEMSSLTNLESLVLAKTCIEMVPSFIGSFQNLKYFNLHGCEKVQKLAPSLGGLKSLEHLNLSYCSEIGDLPASLCCLEELRLLNLSGCTKLQTLPDQLGNLKCLQDLNLEGCSRLKQLPNSLGDLKFLMSLNLSGCCELQEIPESIQRLHALRPHRFKSKVFNNNQMASDNSLSCGPVA